MTRFAFTAEQDELRSVVRAFLERHSSEVAVRAAMQTGSGYDAKVWAQLADQIGVQGLAVPEEYGGAGFGAVEVGIIMEEAGRALLCAPLLSTVVLAAQAVLLSDDDEQRAHLLPGLCAGTTTATVAWIDEPGAQVTARRDGAGWTVDGTKLFVIDGGSAQIVVVSAIVDAEVALFCVDGAAPGLERVEMTTMDLTRKQGRLTFTGVPAAVLVGPDRGAAVLAEVLDGARVALAAEQVGGAERCLETAVAYAKIREQFGRPIGSFQAIKHRCADMLIEVELARSTAYNAVWALADGAGDDVPLAASIAKAMCSDAYVFVATENIQVHGGIGFSWEHSAHLYFRRARSSAVMLGDANHHRDLIARRLGV